jgi:hypothetical protein
MNLLALRDYKDKISVSKRHIYDMFDILKTEYDYKEIDIKLLFEKNVKYILLERFDTLPKNIIILDHTSEIYKFKFNFKTSITIIIDDIHHQGRIKTLRTLSLKKVKNVLSTYGYYFSNKYKSNCDVYFFPHSIRFDCSFNNKPIDKILLSGRLNKEQYPNRDFIYQLSKINSNIEYLKPNVKYRENINILEKENKIYGQKYINYLNKYLCCFCCDANKDRPYIVAKHFEILSSGSLLLTCNENTKEYFKILGLKDNEHYLSCDSTNQEQKINYILDPKNRTLIDTIRKNGYLYAKKYHNYKSRCEYLNKVIVEDFTSREEFINNDTKYYYIK